MLRRGCYKEWAKNMGRPANKDGLTAMERKACELRSEGVTQIEAYLISHKRKRGEGRTAENAAYKLFRKPKCREYLDKLWEGKPLEVIYTPQRWLGHTLDIQAKAEEAGNWPAAANLNRQAGQSVTALRDSMTVVQDGAERDRELIEAMAGKDPALQKALKLIMGSHEVFETPHVVVDNTKPMNGADKGKGGKGK